jgi:ABC-2 type transport system permease protein
MSDLTGMLWIETRKAIRSRMPLWTALGSLFMPFGITFLIFVARNPEISQQLGLVSAKADLMAYAATDWQSYLGLFGMIIAAGGLILFSLVITWVFGREFADGTLKEILAVPVGRLSIVLAKFILAAAWSAALAVVILFAGLVTGASLRLPGGSPGVILQGSLLVLVTAGLVIAVVTPFAFLASVGRGYLLPIGVTVLVLMAANLVALMGWGEYFPWGVPGIYALGDSPLSPVSYAIVLLTGLLGVVATHLWWKYADQSR